jgi:hypothetical protein
MRSGAARFSRTMQLVFAIAESPDFDLTSVEFSLAKDTQALIIERLPASELILGTQNR